MRIEGPFKLAVIENVQTLSRELHLDFTEDFCRLAIAERASALREYVADLRQKIHASAEDSADRQGMLAILQVTEQLLPHIAADEIPLNETIVIEIRSESPLSHLIANNLVS